MDLPPSALAHLAARSEQAGDQVAVYDGVSEGPLEAVLRELTSHHGIVADTTPSNRFNQLQT